MELCGCIYSIETFRFKDKEDYEYVIRLWSFFAYSPNIDSLKSFILPFFTEKIGTFTTALMNVVVQ